MVFSEKDCPNHNTEIPVNSLGFSYIISNRNTTHPNTMEPILTKEEKIKVVILEKIMSEKKTTLRSLRNQDWKKV